MATVGFQAAGTALGGPIGGVIGAAVGSYVDNNFLMPALFPEDPAVGQQIQEMDIQGADEGSPIHRHFARQSRSAGTIIWTPKLFNKRVVTEEVGGKGAPGEDVDRTLYSVDMAVSFGEGPPDGGGVFSVDRVYADTLLIYDDTPNVAISDNTLSCTVDTEYSTQYAIDSEVSEKEKTLLMLVVASPIGGPDLSDLRSGNDAAVAGWTNSDYNGTFRCISSTLDEDGSSVARFEISILAGDAPEAAGNTITIDQTNPKFDTAIVAGVTVYKGTSTQTKDSFITGREGAENISAFRDEIYVVLQGLELEKFGNRPPNIRGVIFTDPTDDLEDVFGDILQQTDLDASEYDITALSSVACEGYTLRGPIPATAAIQPLALCYDIVAQNLAGVLTFFERKDATVVVVAEGDIAARPAGSDSLPWPHRLDRKSGYEPPAEVLVKYRDINNQLQPGQQAERRPNALNLHEKKTVEFAIALDGGQARDVAAKVIWTAKSGQVEHEVSLPPTYVAVAENDILQYTYKSETFLFLVGEVTDGANGTRECKGFQEVVAHTSHSSPHEDPRSPGSKLGSAVDIRLEVIDVGPLESSRNSTPGMYFAAVQRHQSASWRGATIFQSDDDGVTWFSMTSVVREMIIGRTDTELPQIMSAGPAHWDRKSVLEVVLEFGTLSSVTEVECLRGLNRAVVGNEVIGFQTAVLSAVQPAIGTKYDVSKLLRGLAGTERETSVHVAGDRFILLNASSSIFQSFGTSALDSEKDYVAVSPGGDPDDFEKREVVVRANNVRPLFPVNLHGERNLPATNDWTLTWDRRSRQTFRVFSQTAPALEPIEDYIVEVRDGSEVLIATYTSTLTASGTGVTGTTFVYDSVDQIADFGSNQSTVRLRVYQVSDLAVRGRGTATTVFTG